MLSANAQREHAEAHYGEDHDEGYGLLSSPAVWAGAVLFWSVVSFFVWLLA